ncbi:hypothetical protein AGR1B_Cc80161 [Agrobacterium fabacearum S56]|nr:hypothetical protein AGR1B_Cc80161 [Agrobacterium fabacearum S56]
MPGESPAFSCLKRVAFYRIREARFIFLIIPKPLRTFGRHALVDQQCNQQTAIPSPCAAGFSGECGAYSRCPRLFS